MGKRVFVKTYSPTKDERDSARLFIQSLLGDEEPAIQKPKKKEEPKEPKYVPKGSSVPAENFDNTDASIPHITIEDISRYPRVWEFGDGFRRISIDFDVLPEDYYLDDYNDVSQTLKGFIDSGDYTADSIFHKMMIQYLPCMRPVLVLKDDQIPNKWKRDNLNMYIYKHDESGLYLIYYMPARTIENLIELSKELIANNKFISGMRAIVDLLCNPVISMVHALDSKMLLDINTCDFNRETFEYLKDDVKTGWIEAVGTCVRPIDVEFDVVDMLVEADTGTEEVFPPSFPFVPEPSSDEFDEDKEEDADIDFDALEEEDEVASILEDSKHIASSLKERFGNEDETADTASIPVKADKEAFVLSGNINPSERPSTGSTPFPAPSGVAKPKPVPQTQPADNDPWIIQKR